MSELDIWNFRLALLSRPEGPRGRLIEFTYAVCRVCPDPAWLEELPEDRPDLRIAELPEEEWWCVLGALEDPEQTKGLTVLYYGRTAEILDCCALGKLTERRTVEVVPFPADAPHLTQTNLNIMRRPWASCASSGSTLLVSPS